MTYRDALQEGSRRIEASQDDTPYLDALLLLCEAAQLEKELLYASLNDSLTDGALQRFFELCERRRTGIPVAYLLGRQEFFGRSFAVDERVLIPRADTETLIEAVLEVVDANPALRTVHDLGTGSGCIALTLKAERPTLEVSASDVSPGACEVFTMNAKTLDLPVECVVTPYFRSIEGPFDLIVSNAPYLTDAEVDDMRGRGWPEPEGALRAGPAGLDCIAQIVHKSVHYLSEPGYLFLEAAPAQMPIIVDMMAGVGFEEIMVRTDLAGRDRVVGGVKNG